MADKKSPKSKPSKAGYFQKQFFVTERNKQRKAAQYARHMAAAAINARSPAALDRIRAKRAIRFKCARSR